MRYIYSFKKFLMNEEIEYSGDDGFDLLNKFLMKLDVTTTKLKSNLIFDFYRKVVTSKYLPNLEKEVSYITQVLMLLRSGANNKDEKKVVDNLKKIKSALLIDDDGKSPWISDNNIKLHLSKSDARKIGDLHSELLRIMKYFEVTNSYSTKNKPQIQSTTKKEPIKKTEKSTDIWIEKELDSGTKETNLGEIKSQIKIEPRHQIILDMMPDYSNIKASIVNTVGGLGYVGNFKEREINRGKAISTTILFDGLPTSEIFTHELLHYFTIPVLVRYTENPTDFKGSAAETYVTSLMSLAKQAQSNGYSAVNGVSVHNNLNEFAVNITNEESCNKLKSIKVSTTDGKSTTAYDMLMKITSDYLNSLSNKKQVDKTDSKITKNNSDEKVKGKIIVDGKIISCQDVQGSIDYTGISGNTDLKTMPEFLPLISNWDSTFVKNRLCNFNGQYLFEYSGRVFIFVKVGGWPMPFYYSSKGTSGKAINWHFVFGIDSEQDWIIKGFVDTKGEMVFGEPYTKWYPKAITELERTKNELRTSLEMTTNTRDKIRGLLYQNEKKYNKDLLTVFKNWKVTSGMSSAGMEVNDNYYHLLNIHLNFINSSV